MLRRNIIPEQFCIVRYLGSPQVVKSFGRIYMYQKIGTVHIDSSQGSSGNQRQTAKRYR